MSQLIKRSLLVGTVAALPLVPYADPSPFKMRSDLNKNFIQELTKVDIPLNVSGAESRFNTAGVISGTIVSASIMWVDKPAGQVGGSAVSVSLLVNGVSVSALDLQKSTAEGIVADARAVTQSTSTAVSPGTVLEGRVPAGLTSSGTDIGDMSAVLSVLISKTY